MLGSIPFMKNLKTIFIFVLTGFIFHVSIIAIDGLTAKPVKSEYAIILGNTVNPDGSLSLRLKARVDKGLELYNDSLVTKIFVSGGLGNEGHYEGQVMANYLIQHGVAETDIMIDNSGNTTWLTTNNFKEMNPNCKSVIIVTQFYHISRSKLAVSKVGIKHVSTATPSYYEWIDLYSLFREFFAL